MSLFPEKPTAAVIIRHLQERYSGNEWATFTELADSTGSMKGRTIDFYALNLWPSKAYLSAAYEVKVSRADFRRELDNPGKRAPWEKRASECWFVAPVGIIPLGEVPEGWGLLELGSNGFKAMRRAHQRKIESFTPDFVAAMARRMHDKPPAEPLFAWEWAGRKIGGVELMRLAEKWHRRQAEDRSYEVSHQKAALERMKTLGPLIGRLNAAMGRSWGQPTLEEFEAWLAGKGGGPNALDDVERVYRSLGRAIARVRGVEE